MGLMAAMEILKAGHEVDIYERDDRIGGMSAAFDFDGLQIERYYHFVCKTDDPLFELMAELGISDTLKSAIDTAAQALAPWIEGPRHTEEFDACA